MIYRTLGRTDLEVSAIAMGCWQFAGGSMWGEQDDADSIRAVHAALDSGITLFDTAEGYGAGKSEEVLGEALVGKRQNAVVATKSSGPTFARDELIGACEKSLKRLRTDYIDIYQLHWPREDATSSDLILETAAELVESGKIRYFGVCNYGPENLKEMLAHGSIASDQLNYSLLWRGIEAEIVPILQEHEIGILTYSSLLHGLLSGKYHSLDEFPVGRARSLHFSSDREDVRHGQPGQEALTNRTIARIGDICKDAGYAMADAAFGWALHQPQVTSVLAGARNTEQVVANAAIADIDFSTEFLGKLTEATEELKQAFGGAVDMWIVPPRIR